MAVSSTNTLDQDKKLPNVLQFSRVRVPSECLSTTEEPSALYFPAPDKGDGSPLNHIRMANSQQASNFQAQSTEPEQSLLMHSTLQLRCDLSATSSFPWGFNYKYTGQIRSAGTRMIILHPWLLRTRCLPAGRCDPILPLPSISAKLSTWQGEAG